MRFFIFTERNREVLQSELDGTLDKKNNEDRILVAVLKNRIRKHQATLIKDVNLMKEIIIKFNLDDL